MTNHWLDEAKKSMLVDPNPLDAEAHFERLVALGIIDENGEVTGHLHRWDAYLAIFEVKYSTDRKQIERFRCLKPVFGIPGGETKDVSRASIVDYLKAGKKLITAHRDVRLSLWREDCEVHLSPSGFVQCTSADGLQDNVGNLPEFQRSESRI